MRSVSSRLLRVFALTATAALLAPISARSQTVATPQPIVIDFDYDPSGNPINAPGNFDAVANPALSTLYTALGVTFSGSAGAGSGGAIVNHDQGGFSVPTRSGANFLAFVSNVFPNGYATGPETITFNRPVSAVTLYAISPGTSQFTIRAYSAANLLLASSSVYAPEYYDANFNFDYYPLTVQSPLGLPISYVTVQQQSLNPPDNRIYEFDDLSFTPALSVLNSATARGRVLLEGVDDSSAIFTPVNDITIALRTPGTQIVQYIYTVKVASAGAGSPYFTYAIQAPFGTYDVAIKNDKSLRVALPNVTFSALSTIPDALLPTGDADNSNSCDVLDFGILVNAYGSGRGFPFNPNNPYDPAPDFNYDGVVDVLDFGLLVNEYGFKGAN